MTPDDVVVVAELYNHMIREVDLSNGMVSTLAGSTTRGSQDGMGTSAGFNLPQGVAVKTDGSFVVVADTENHMLRHIVRATGVVSTIAGSTSPGSQDGAGSDAKFKSIFGVALTPDGNCIVSDMGNHKIRLVSLENGDVIVSTLAGSVLSGLQDGIGSSAGFKSPRGVSLTADGGKAIIADSGNNLLRQILLNECASCPSDSGGGGASVSHCICNAGFTGQDGICIGCVPGKFKPTTGSAACTGCNVNSYTTGSAIVCKNCTTGTKSPSRSVSEDNCTDIVEGEAQLAAEGAPAALAAIIAITAVFLALTAVVGRVFYMRGRLKKLLTEEELAKIVSAVRETLSQEYKETFLKWMEIPRPSKGNEFFSEKLSEALQSRLESQSDSNNQQSGGNGNEDTHMVAGGISGVARMSFGPLQLPSWR